MRATAEDHGHGKEGKESKAMKRFHGHIRVDDLESSVRCYTLFGKEPAVLKSGYAKWMLDDPRVNFAITSGTGSPAEDHLGIQAGDAEPGVIAGRFEAEGRSLAIQQKAKCCHARGNKSWVLDPGSIRWGSFVPRRQQHIGQRSCPNRGNI
jgi:hypothetical protein